MALARNYPMCKNAKDRNATRISFFSLSSKCGALPSLKRLNGHGRTTSSIKRLGVFAQPRPKADMGSGPLKSASDAWLIRDSDTFRARS